MRTPEEARIANLEKQRRFLARHPGYHRRHTPIDPIMVGLEPSQCNYCTFALGDPRGDGTPHIIAHGLVTNKPLWSALWSVRKYSLSPWAWWLRDLDKKGLEPVLLPGWSIGIHSAIDWRAAHRFVALEIRRLSKASTGDASVCPSWLYRTVEVREGWSQEAAMSLGCRTATRRVKHYSSMKEAAYDSNTTCSTHIRNCVWRCCADSQGRLWFDD